MRSLPSAVRTRPLVLLLFATRLPVRLFVAMLVVVVVVVLLLRSVGLRGLLSVHRLRSRLRSLLRLPLRLRRWLPLRRRLPLWLRRRLRLSRRRRWMSVRSRSCLFQKFQC